MWWPRTLSDIQDRRQSHSLSHHAKEASFLISTAGRLLSLRQSWAQCPSSRVFVGLDLTGALLSAQISTLCLDERWIPTSQGQGDRAEHDRPHRVRQVLGQVLFPLLKQNPHPSAALRCFAGGLWRKSAAL